MTRDVNFGGLGAKLVNRELKFGALGAKLRDLGDKFWNLVALGANLRGNLKGLKNQVWGFKSL